METLGNKDALLIDMDGVVTDTVGGAFRYVEQRYPDLTQRERPLAHEDVTDYGFTEVTLRREIFEAFRSEGFYRHLDVIHGAVRAINRLREEYSGNVIVCSAPIPGAEQCESEKRDFLAEHFDDEFARDALIVPDKSLVLGRVLIEDNPHISGGSWQPIMYDQPWNRTQTAYPRMYGWHDLQVVRDEMNRPDIES